MTYQSCMAIWWLLWQQKWERFFPLNLTHMTLSATKVSAEMNDLLVAPYMKEEVKTALFQMFPTKAPGPDGFPAHFYQHYWELCGAEVTEVVLRIIRGEESAESINNTVLVLIPKVMNPFLLTQFRPISLCNVLYKIASKVIANRLK